MKLKSYLDQQGMKYPELGEQLSISKQQVHQYATLFNAPGLELAMLLFVHTGGAVQLSDMLPDKKRKRSAKGQNILTILDWESDIITKP